jgi:hypothetical protein
MVDWTHTTRESGMEAASAAISPLGFGLDLMVHKVLMRMRGGAWRGVLVLVRGWLKLDTGWRRAEAKWPQGCGEATTAEVRATGGRRVNGVNPDPSWSIYGGPPDLPVAVPSAVQHATMALSR